MAQCRTCLKVLELRKSRNDPLCVGHTTASSVGNRHVYRSIQLSFIEPPDRSTIQEIKWRRRRRRNGREDEKEIGARKPFVPSLPFFVFSRSLLRQFKLWVEQWHIESFGCKGYPAITEVCFSYIPATTGQWPTLVTVFSKIDFSFSNSS